MTEDPRLLRAWREREMQFPPFTRRMKPDEMDYTSGAVEALRVQVETRP